MPTYSGQGTALTKSSGAAYNFTPMTDWLSTDEITEIRAALETRGMPTECMSVRPAFLKANDKEAPAATVDTIANTTARGSDGISYGSDWDDVTGDLDGYRWVRFGVESSRTKSDGTLGCFATIRIDVLESR